MKRALILASVASMIDQFNRNHILWLQELGYKVDVACNFEFGSTTSQERVELVRSELEASGVSTYHIPIPRKIHSIKDIRTSYQMTRQLLSDNSYDLVHCHSPIGGVIARLTGRSHRGQGMRMIYTAHGFHFYENAPLANWMIYYPIERLCASFTDVLITINQEDYERAKRFMAGAVSYVPGVGVEKSGGEAQRELREPLRREFGVEPQECMIVSVGELNVNKNHEVVIKALASIEMPYKYVICGTGHKKAELQQLAERLGVQDKVVFAGYRNDVQHILQAADVFCLPSIREGLSVALMEALSAGLPCVASKIRGNVDLIRDAQGGYLVDSKHVDGFRESLEGLISDPVTREKFGDFNREYANHFSVDTVKSHMMNIYQSPARSV
ncbi:glycosyltransferase family 4 protein [Paenibacillus sp. sgz500958]|uniref:glycosyltransferase family 4 protein n=1 Tax=Paenibacillus sp. sgz500958 TaxID=3242475 RepID=UPI0036D2AC47